MGKTIFSIKLCFIQSVCDRSNYMCSPCFPLYCIMLCMYRSHICYPHVCAEIEHKSLFDTLLWLNYVFYMFTNRQIICVCVVVFFFFFLSSSLPCYWCPFVLFAVSFHIGFACPRLIFQTGINIQYVAIDHLTCNSHFLLLYSTCINNVAHFSLSLAVGSFHQGFRTSQPCNDMNMSVCRTKSMSVYAFVAIT